MGNRVATPCFAPEGGGGRDHPAEEAAEAGGSIGHVLSFGGRETPAFAGAIHGVLLPSNQSTQASTSASVINDLWSVSGSSSFDSSNSFSFRTLQPRQSSGQLDYCSSPSAATAASGPSVTRQLSRTDEQILTDLYATRHRRHCRASKNSVLGGLRRAVASVMRSKKKGDEGVGAAVANGRGVGGSVHGRQRNDKSGKNCEVTDGVSVKGAAGVQWARGKAGEDRVHVVVSEEHGWMFVGIYDGFNGSDATDYLLANLYASVCRKLDGMLSEDEPEQEPDERVTGRGAARHREVLDALARALRETEERYFAEVDARAAESPELAMLGSCVLVVLMKGADVYVMNVGDSRAVLAHRPAEPDLSRAVAPGCGGGSHAHDLAGIKEEIRRQFDASELGELAAVQLTMDHTTGAYKEVRRIRREHLDDPACIVNGRVKGSLKVTRAFGAGYLKEPRWNRALLEVFRVDYVGASPYITCRPYLRHHRLGRRDKFLVLSSDGLYQYFTNEEVVTQVEAFTSRYPDDDPAKYLSQVILLRAANLAGMEFNELIDIPQGDRRRYHDDISILIISLEGKMWRSSV